MTETKSSQRLAALPVDHLMEKIAADRPLLPAAGSATALVGATAASMGEFVARIARRHVKTEAAAGEIDSIVEGFERLRRRFADLITEDVRAYSGAVAAIRSGGGDEKKARMQMIAPPESMAQGGLETFEWCLRLRPHIYEPTKADFAVAVETTRACVDSALRILRESLHGFNEAERHLAVDRIETLRRTCEDHYARLLGVF